MKGEVRGKRISFGWNFSCFSVHYSQSSVLTYRARRPSRSVSKPAKQDGGQIRPTIVLFGTRGPWLFRVVREGLGSGVRLGARGTQRLADRLRLALEPQSLENPTATARKIPEMDWTRSNYRQADCAKWLSLQGQIGLATPACTWARCPATSG
jgi:hypothetical protein